MTDEAFDHLVSRLTRTAARHPHLFVWRTGSLVFLGLAYLGFIFLLTVCLTLAAPALVILLPTLFYPFILMGLSAGGLVWAIVKSLWIRFPAPQGWILDNNNAPALMELIGKLQQELNSIPFHRVLLTNDYNAAVSQVPRLGLLGWPRNYLILGLPLMLSLSAAEFTNVLAHEFAHLSRGHGRFQKWLYHTRRTWERLFYHFARRQHGGGRVFRKSLLWFWPQLNAHAFVLSRANEYEADAGAARLAGTIPTVNALIRVAVYTRHLEESFWRPLFRRAHQQPAPPDNIFEEMEQRLATGPPPEQATKWMHLAFLVKTDNTDTHPCLRERVAALPDLLDSGPPTHLPPLVQPHAAANFLGLHLATHSANLGKEWADQNRAPWDLRHAESLAMAEELETAGGSRLRGRQPVDVLWKKAEAVMELEGLGAAQEWVDEILVQDWTHAGALFARGAWRLRQDDQGGIQDVERVIGLDSDLSRPALLQLAEYYHRHGLTDELKAVRRRYEAQEDLTWEARAERAGVNLNDPLRPHNLPTVALERLHYLLAMEPAVRRAWCSQKLLRHQKKRPLHLLCLELKVPWGKHRLPGFQRAVVNRLRPLLPFSADSIIFVRAGHAIQLADKMGRMADALIYQKSGSASGESPPH